MFHLKKSRAAKIILLCLGLTVIDKGWVTKTHSFEIGALAIGQEALYALTLGCSMLWRACTNSKDSAVDRILEQEINRLTNRNYAPDTRSAVSANSSSQVPALIVTEQVKAVPIKAVTPVHVSPASVQKINNVTDKARAVVSHVTHEQVAQATYAAIPEVEKIASRELLNDVAIDWHKQIEHNCSESIRFARTNAHNQMQAQIQEWNRGCTLEVHPNGGVTLHTPNPIVSLYLGPSRQQHTHILADDIAEQRAQEQLQIACNPYTRAAIRNGLCAFLNNAHSLLYGTLIERVAALVYLADFHINEHTFGEPLYNVQREIYAKYAYIDGSICIDRLADMTDAHTIVKKYSARYKKIAPLFEKHCVHARSRNTDQLIKKARKVDLRAIRNNRTNQCYRKMLSAFASGDMQQVEQIKNNNRATPGIQTLYGQMRSAYNATVAQQEALLKDPYGILHFNLPTPLQDPLFTALSEHNRAQLQHNPQALSSLNDALLMRNRYKQALHKAWSIPTTTEPAVHQTLYALIDSGTIPERIDKIHEVANNPQLSQSERKLIVRALFLPNGIIKDFADYNRTQSLKMPAAILQPEHAKTRALLNKLVYAERVCGDQHLQNECTRAIEYLQTAVVADNEDSAQLYLLYAQNIFEHIKLGSNETLILFNSQQPTDNDGKAPQQNQPPDQKGPEEPENNEPDSPISPGAAATALLKAIDNSKEKAIEIFNKTCEWITTDPNGLQAIRHAFVNKPGHNFGPLLTRMGANIADESDVIRVGSKTLIDVTEKLIAMGSKLPLIKEGVYYNVLVDYGGEIITTRGRIIHGMFKMSTMFIQPQHVR